MENKLLYHYTTIDTFSTMLENSLWSEDKESLVPTHMVMWATHCNFLNDKTEYRLFVNGLKYQVEQYAQTQGTTMTEEHFRMLDNSVTYNDAFVLSFSEKADDLGMWRGYAGDGQGVCLGFDFNMVKSEMMHLASKEVFSSSKKYTSQVEKETILSHNQLPQKCSYVHPDPCGMEIDASVIKEFFQLLTNKSEDGFEDIKLMMQTRFLSPLYKHFKYADECEWRIVINDMNNYKYRKVDGQLLPYREVRIPIECLKTIIIGPCLAPDVMVGRLATLSRSRLVKKVEIVPSEIPYRNRL